MFEATDKNTYTAQDLAEALTAAQREAQRVELDPHTVNLVLLILARRWHLTALDGPDVRA